MCVDVWVDGLAVGVGGEDRGRGSINLTLTCVTTTWGLNYESGLKAVGRPKSQGY